MFAYFIAISDTDVRMVDGDLTVFEMFIPELVLFIYGIVGMLIGWFYAIKCALQNGHKFWAFGVFIFLPLNVIYLARHVR